MGEHLEHLAFFEFKFQPHYLVEGIHSLSDVDYWTEILSASVRFNICKICFFLVGLNLHGEQTTEVVFV